MKPLAALAKGICLFRHFAAQAMAFADVANRTALLCPPRSFDHQFFSFRPFLGIQYHKRILGKLENAKRASVYACIANISTMNAILPEVWITNS